MKYIIIIVIVVIIIAAVIWWIIGQTNYFKAKPVDIQQALSNIDVALTKRYAVLKKQMDVAKGYAKHEKETFEMVINLRKGMTAGELAEANRQMDVMQGQINALAENYPELRSSDVFLKLQGSINVCEQDLAAARRIYNKEVSDFNKARVSFPSSLFAGGTQPFEMFTATETERQDVVMDF